MLVSMVHQIAALDTPPLVAIALSDSRIQIWSWSTGKQLGEFKSNFTLGGKRMALTPDGAVCITGGWGRGLAAYSVPSGDLLWHRRDIHRLQSITLNASGNDIYCGIETRTVLVIDVKTGETTSKIARAEKVFASMYSPHELVVKKDKYMVRGESEVTIPALSFGLHTSAFSPGTVCFSEPHAGARCVDLRSCELLWHHPSIYFNQAIYHPRTKLFYCTDCDESTPPNWFIRKLANHYEECVIIAPIYGGWKTAFTNSGTYLLTATGDLYETATGTLLRHLDFPQKDYPDMI
jgi:WD40 repeat protein